MKENSRFTTNALGRLRSKFFLAALALLLIGLALWLKDGADQTTTSTGSGPELESALPIPVAVKTKNSTAKSPLFSLRELVKGASAAKLVSDADLESWIEENEGSEAAWLVALSHRFLHPDWNKRALEAHPDSPTILFSAANIDLLSAKHDATSTRGKSHERLVEVDQQNGITWFYSGVAALLRDDTKTGMAHLSRAADASGFYGYDAAFYDANHAFAKAKGYSDSGASLIAYGSRSHLPVIVEALNKIREEISVLRDRGEDEKADKVADTGYQIGIHLLEAQGLQTFESYYRLSGVNWIRKLGPEISYEMQLISSESFKKAESYAKEYRDISSRMPDEPGQVDETKFVIWAEMMQHVGWHEASRVVFD